MMLSHSAKVYKCVYILYNGIAFSPLKKSGIGDATRKTIKW